VLIGIIAGGVVCMLALLGAVLYCHFSKGRVDSLSSQDGQKEGSQWDEEGAADHSATQGLALNAATAP